MLNQFRISIALTPSSFRVLVFRGSSVTVMVKDMIYRNHQVQDISERLRSLLSPGPHSAAIDLFTCHLLVTYSQPRQDLDVKAYCSWQLLNFRLRHFVSAAVGIARVFCGLRSSEGRRLKPPQSISSHVTCSREAIVLDRCPIVTTTSPFLLGR